MTLEEVIEKAWEYYDELTQDLNDDIAMREAEGIGISYLHILGRERDELKGMKRLIEHLEELLD